MSLINWFSYPQDAWPSLVKNSCSRDQSVLAGGWPYRASICGQSILQQFPAIIQRMWLNWWAATIEALCHMETFNKPTYALSDWIMCCSNPAKCAMLNVPCGVSCMSSVQVQDLSPLSSLAILVYDAKSVWCWLWLVYWIESNIAFQHRRLSEQLIAQAGKSDSTGKSEGDMAISVLFQRNTRAVHFCQYCMACF